LLVITLSAVLIVAIILDVRSRRQIDRIHTQLAGAKAFLDTIMRNIPAPVIVKDPESRRIILANHAYERFSGMSSEALVGATLHDVFPKDLANEITNYDTATLSHPKPLISRAIELESKRLGRRIVDTTRVAVRDEAGNVQYLIAIVDV